MVPLEKLVTAAQEHCCRLGRPLVTLSYAQSLDGCIAARAGERLALSGPQSLQMTHQLRAAHEAILVGVGTILADNPRLTVRLVQGQNPQPIVLDSHLCMPLEASLFQNPRLPWIACLEEADQRKSTELEALGVRILRLPADSAGRVSIPALLEHLANLEVNSLMVEGGASVISAFLHLNLVDWVILTIAPVFLGGLRAVGSDIFASISRSPGPYPRLQETGAEWLGNDLIIWGWLTACG
jgi:3,4-dihydroxy 2-butanone 4-phosphate synthase/GTP cyclohydrolase II